MNIKRANMDNIDSVSQKTKTWFRYELQNYPKTKTKSDGGGSVAGPQLWFIWPLGGGQGDQPTF